MRAQCDFGPEVCEQRLRSPREVYGLAKIYFRGSASSEISRRGLNNTKRYVPIVWYVSAVLYVAVAGGAVFENSCVCAFFAVIMNVGIVGSKAGFRKEFDPSVCGGFYIFI